MRLYLKNQLDTEALGASLATLCSPGDCLALDGSYGMGKSTFARSFLRALTGDVALDVPSPSFPILLTYDTPAGPAFHYDLWRLEGPDALDELDWDAACEGIMLVEWPERAEDMLPNGALHVTFEQGAGEDERVVSLTGWPDARLAKLKV
ncbi:ATP/GTP hydrolase [Neokomagataea thailandica NBRC 106555]|uniref:tRNA threonylcarbamoyladenosine biosynthesis protein TsaE n=2 Tax=Neokomagataea TaxID=1223423 RepID=A0A4Y6V9K6_9PROT|nr:MULTISPECIES: tRNA (adenosine(37)-N6)-threonylcarbamoyltransferase complex ATPase subunit type 1 TsaE [Neokomagataea]QDH25176.1 tRNA (adenosine(37)-N6)-threonylcarbamoyltransferase complex ATPase subunit type 1 TsaE [Neokomagataea tanensis]GBR51920.1 ATP/GTP hydrolase [Neokomagataea thailandica NBRC 106555]